MISKTINEPAKVRKTKKQHQFEKNITQQLMNQQNYKEEETDKQYQLGKQF